MKKYREYMKEGITLSKTCLKNNGIFKYYIYYFITFLLKISIFLEPFAGVSKYEIKNQIKQNKGINISTLFKGCDNRGYTKLLVANILKFTIFFAAILTLGILGGAFYALGIGVAFVANFYESVALFFIIPAGVLILVLLIAIPFIQGPNAYIVNRFDHLNSTGVLYNSFNTYKEGGRLINFLMILSNYLPRIIYIGIAVVVCYFTMNAFKNPINIGVTFIIGVLFFFVYIFVAPFISLMHIVAKTLLLDDIVCDRYYDDIKVENPNEEIKNIKILKKHKQKSYKLLFDDADKFMNTESYVNSLNEIKEAEAKELENRQKLKEKDSLDDYQDEVNTDEPNALNEIDEDINENLDESNADEDINEEEAIEEAAETLEDNQQEDLDEVENTEFVAEEPVEETEEKVTEEVQEEPTEIVEEAAEETTEVEGEAIEEPVEETEELTEEPVEEAQEEQNEEFIEESAEEDPVQESSTEDSTDNVQEVTYESLDDLPDDVIIEEVEEEQIVYVDEDGNEIPTDELEFVEEPVEEIEEFTEEEPAEEAQEEPIEEPKEITEEKPKRTRKASTKKASDEEKPKRKRTTKKSEE